jgi:tetratricopeptide (TPR) repeat protein
MKKIIVVILVLAFTFEAYGLNSRSDEADALFAKGEYLKGINILTAAINDPNPVQQADALQTYAKFYENFVGNTDYALTLYGNILKTNLPPNHPIKVSAQKEIDRLRLLKTQYGSENVLLRKLRPAETMNLDENGWLIVQLCAIIDKKPEYYRLSEVYYYLGRNYLVVGNYRQAYTALKKTVELKPAVNFYLPVNVYKDMAYAKWIRAIINTVLYGTAGTLLIVTMAAFYASRPWKWLRPRHLIAGSAIILLWLIILVIAYPLLVSGHGISDKTIAEISAAPPCFISYWTDNSNQQVLKSLFLYGLIGISVIFVFSTGTSRLKCRWAVLLINTVFALLLFTTLTTIFYMQNCDQKSVFNSESQTGILGYIRGGSYFVSFNIEPYILTNPRAYPNLAINNITDVHLREWIQKHCPFSPPVKQTSP